MRLPTNFAIPIMPRCNTYRAYRTSSRRRSFSRVLMTVHFTETALSFIRYCSQTQERRVMRVSKRKEEKIKVSTRNDADRKVVPRGCLTDAAFKQPYFNLNVTPFASFFFARTLIQFAFFPEAIPADVSYPTSYSADNPSRTPHRRSEKRTTIGVTPTQLAL